MIIIFLQQLKQKENLLASQFIGPMKQHLLHRPQSVAKVF